MLIFKHINSVFYLRIERYMLKSACFKWNKISTEKCVTRAICCMHQANIKISKSCITKIYKRNPDSKHKITIFICLKLNGNWISCSWFAHRMTNKIFIYCQKPHVIEKKNIQCYNYYWSTSTSYCFILRLTFVSYKTGSVEEINSSQQLCNAVHCI